MFCSFIIWFEFIILFHLSYGDNGVYGATDPYGVGGGQQVLDVEPSITWDADGGYIMFCLCMG